MRVFKQHVAAETCFITDSSFQTDVHLTNVFNIQLRFPHHPLRLPDVTTSEDSSPHDSWVCICVMFLYLCKDQDPAHSLGTGHVNTQRSIWTKTCITTIVLEVKGHRESSCKCFLMPVWVTWFLFPVVSKRQVWANQLPPHCVWCQVQLRERAGFSLGGFPNLDLLRLPAACFYALMIAGWFWCISESMWK